MNQNDFVLLINPFKDKLFRLAKRLLISTEEAEDATQEIMVKLWSKNENIESYNSVEAMAMTMTKNYCLDQLRSKRSGNLKIEHINFTAKAPSLDKQVEDNDSLQWVEKIINKLPEQQRLIIQLRDIEQCEFSEIAKIAEMNETAVRVALSRARKTIREYMLKANNYGVE